MSVVLQVHFAPTIDDYSFRWLLRLRPTSFSSRCSRRNAKVRVFRVPRRRRSCLAGLQARRAGTETWRRGQAKPRTRPTSRRFKSRGMRDCSSARFVAARKRIHLRAFAPYARICGIIRRSRHAWRRKFHDKL